MFKIENEIQFRNGFPHFPLMRSVRNKEKNWNLNFHFY
jgi:hypothetical protein